MKFIKSVLTLLFFTSSLFSASKSDKALKNYSYTKNQKNKVAIQDDDEYPKPNSEFRIHDMGLLWLGLSNTGYFGNPNSAKNPCTGKIAKGAELPGNSGNTFLWEASLMFGGYLDSVEVVIDGKSCTRFQGPLVSTGYQGSLGFDANHIYGATVQELWPTAFQDGNMEKGKLKESSNIKGHENCFYDDIYDPKATAEQQFTTWYTDKYTNNAFTNSDDVFPVPKDQKFQRPLGIEIKQKSYAWSYEYAQKFIIIDYTLYNRNDEGKDIYDFFMGLDVDCDVGNFSMGDWISGDDVVGFIQSTEIINEDTGEPETVNLNLAWVADNDGREYIGVGGAIYEQPPMSPLNGATSVATIRVLRSPNPKLKHSFNEYIPNGSVTYGIDEQLDWSPRWKDGFHDDWKYDLTYKQKGYSDGAATDTWGFQKGLGGLTEGRPLGDPGRYMVMSNGEFDYDLWKLDPISNPTGQLFPDPPNTPWQYQQVNKWKGWDDNDGTDFLRADIANGKDVRYILSFGPLGKIESMVNVATANGIIENKPVQKFAYGDSVKLTIAFIVNTNFHTRLEADPNKPAELYQGYNWTDAFRNVVWAERAYDIPLYDTQKMEISGLDTFYIGDGWYGEDVGKDGSYAAIPGSVCWWKNETYTGADEGEGDFKITYFDSPINGADNEDQLCKLGNTEYTYIDPISHKGIGLTEKYGKLSWHQIGFNSSWEPIFEKVRYGWSDEQLTAGDGIPDFKGPMPPPSPQIRVKYQGKEISITWTSDNFGNKNSSPSETTPDFFSHTPDFEGYQILISPDKIPSHFVEIFNVDKENLIYEDIKKPKSYFDKPIAMSEYLKHPQNYPAILPDSITNSTKIYHLVPFGNNISLYKNYSKPNLYDYTATQNDDSTWTYQFILKDITYVDKKYIAITASDYGDPKFKVPSLRSSPSQNAVAIIATSTTKSKSVYVVPNPYRVDGDYKKQKWENVESGQWSDSDRKIVFYNIPKKSIIRIYTLAGDLVKTISHNSNSVNSYGQNATKWNLLNDNAQSVTSGLYLFSVKDIENDSYNQVGKFVIIK